MKLFWTIYEITTLDESMRVVSLREARATVAVSTIVAACIGVALGLVLQ